MYKIYYPHIIMALLGIGMILFGVGMGRSDTLPSQTEIAAYNPYRIGVRLEVKCDWSNTSRAFLYHQIFTIKGKESVKIVVPNKFKKCEIWPKIVF